MKELLKQLGLEEKEIEIYLACLSKQFNTPTDIAKQSGIKRSTVYFYLEKLIDKGLITYNIRGTKKYIKALPVRSTLLQYVKKNKENLSQQEKTIEKLPIDEIVRFQNNQTNVYSYEGRAGVKLVIDKILAEKKDIYWLGSIDTILGVIDEQRLYKFFTIKRMSQNTSAFALTDKKILNYAKFSEMLGNFRAFKFIDGDFKIPALLILFEGVICIISTEGSIKTVLIEDKLMYQIIYFLFHSYWNLLPMKN